MSSGDRVIRTANAADAGAILALNAESVWAMSPLDESGLQRLLDMDGHTLVATDGRAVVGFAVSLAPAQPYISANYHWFAERFDDFLYLDRVAVGAASRRQGIASTLYDALEQAALRHGRMLCEVNIKPRNDVSLAFHTSRGYAQVGVLEHEGGKTVAMLEKRLNAASDSA